MWTPRRRRPSIRRAVATLVLAAAAGLVTPACGTPADPHGRWDPGRRTLVLSGTAAEMGRAQGRLLRDRVRALYARWRADLFRAALGVGPDEGGAAARALAEHLENVVDAAAFRLPERLRQELDALAGAVGLEPLALLELEVMRDALRMRGLAPRLPGTLLVEAGSGGDIDLEMRWWGPDAARLAGEAIWVRREPSDGRPATVTLAWPGALGGLLTATAEEGRGALVAAVEVDVPAPWKGFGHGLPFSIAVRAGVEDGADLRTVAGALKGTVGHVAVTLDLGPGADPRAVASTEAYLTPEKVVLVLDPSSAPLLLAGPHADLGGEAQASLDGLRTGGRSEASAALERDLGSVLPAGEGGEGGFVARWQRTVDGVVQTTMGPHVAGAAR